MDKYEYRVRAEEINALIEKKEYAEAVKIADTIDWRRVKSVMMLCKVSDLYKMNRRYEDSKEVLLLAYDRHPGGRKIIYSLCELCIKLEEIVQAVEYYKEFVQVAPRDTGRFILQYRLYEAQDVSLEERIAVLEEYKKRDYREKWAYELAYLYHRIGLATRCVEECDELILWFGEGRYVVKAMELKMLHEPLTPAQQEKYDRYRTRKTTVGAPISEEAVLAAGQTANIDITGETNDGSTTLPISIKAVEVSNAPTAKIPSRKVQEELDEPEEEADTDEEMMSDDEMEEAEEIAATQTLPQDEIEKKLSEEEDNEEVSEETSEEVSDTEEEEEEENAETSDDVKEQDNDLDIQIKPIDVGEYNTINLQQELAKNLAKMLAEEDMEAMDATKALPIDTILESTDPNLIKGITDDSIKNAIVAPLLQDTAELTPITEEDLLASLDEKPKTVDELNQEEAAQAEEEKTGAEETPQKTVEIKTSEVKEAVAEPESESDKQVNEPVDAASEAETIAAEETETASTDETDKEEVSEAEAESAADAGRVATGVTAAINATVRNMDEVVNTPQAQEQEEPKGQLSREDLMRVISERASMARNGIKTEQEAQPEAAQQEEEITQDPVAEPEEATKNPATEPEEVAQNPVAEPEEVTQNPATEPEEVTQNPVAESEEATQNPVAELEADSQNPTDASVETVDRKQEAVHNSQADKHEQEMINEQISGQLSFTDIMAEWEETKKASEEKHREEMRQRVLKQTGPMFADFDAVARESVSSNLDLISPMEDVFKDTEELATEVENALEADIKESEEKKQPSVTDHIFKEAHTSLQKEEQAGEPAELDDEPVKTKIFNTAEIRGIEEQLLNNLQRESTKIEPELVTPVIPETAPMPQIPETTNESVVTQEPIKTTDYVPQQEITSQSEVTAAPEIPKPYIPAAEMPMQTVGNIPQPVLNPTVTPEPRPQINAMVETGDIEFTDLTQDTAQIKMESAGRELTKQEKELFGAFAQTKEVEKQIANAIDKVSLTPYSGNVLISGTAGTGTLNVAKNLIKMVQATNPQFSHKVAKITGSILDKKDIRATMGSLENGALIVEKAGDLTPHVCETIVNYLGGLSQSQGFLMILEDTRGNIDKLLSSYGPMANTFNIRIDVAALDNDGLVNYGKEYAKEQEYAIDDMGMLALYTRIADMQTNDHHVTMDEVKSIVDEAIANANKKSVSHLVDVLLAKRYDAEDMIVLREKDFLKDR